ncbi:hypothetical protein AcV5_008132 [Taiwanofungus camphoratus]|nr:hypothetical protein AcV5_008132 [Antrodia cinnamomea]
MLFAHILRFITQELLSDKVRVALIEALVPHCLHPPSDPPPYDPPPSPTYKAPTPSYPIDWPLASISTAGQVGYVPSSTHGYGGIIAVLGALLIVIISILSLLVVKVPSTKGSDVADGFNFGGACTELAVSRSGSSSQRNSGDVVPSESKTAGWIVTTIPHATEHSTVATALVLRHPATGRFTGSRETSLVLAPRRTTGMLTRTTGAGACSLHTKADETIPLLGERRPLSPGLSSDSTCTLLDDSPVSVEDAQTADDSAAIACFAVYLLGFMAGLSHACGLTSTSSPSVSPTTPEVLSSDVPGRLPPDESVGAYFATPWVDQVISLVPRRKLYTVQSLPSQPSGESLMLSQPYGVPVMSESCISVLRDMLGLALVPISAVRGAALTIAPGIDDIIEDTVHTDDIGFYLSLDDIPLLDDLLRRQGVVCWQFVHFDVDSTSQPRLGDRALVTLYMSVLAPGAHPDDSTDFKVCVELLSGNDAATQYRLWLGDHAVGATILWSETMDDQDSDGWQYQQQDSQPQDFRAESGEERDLFGDSVSEDDCDTIDDRSGCDTIDDRNVHRTEAPRCIEAPSHIDSVNGDPVLSLVTRPGSEHQKAPRRKTKRGGVRRTQQFKRKAAQMAAAASSPGSDSVLVAQ